MFHFSRKSKDSPNFNIEMRHHRATKKCKKNEMNTTLETVLKKKLSENSFTYLHKIARMIPYLCNDQISLFEVINGYRFVDVHSIMKGGVFSTPEHYIRGFM